MWDTKNMSATVESDNVLNLVTIPGITNEK